MPRPLLAPSLISLFTALAVAAPPGAPAQPPADPGALALSDQPIYLRSIGLYIRLPLGAKFESTEMSEGQAAFTVTAEDRSWRIRLHTPGSGDLTLTPADIAKSLLNELLASREIKGHENGPRSAVKVLDREDGVTINNVPAARFYVSLPAASGNTVVVSGYTVLQSAPGRFAVLQMDCLEPEYARARPQYETIVATTEFRDPADIAAERAAGIGAAQSLLEGLGRDDLEAALPPSEPVWYRIFRPGPTGRPADDTEIAYQRIGAALGHRGELDPRKNKAQWRGADQDPGFVVRIDARLLQGESIVDSESIFFLTPDRDEEAWTIRMVVKEGRKTPLTFVETGVRQGDDIKVTVEQPGRPPVIKQWRKPPEAYLSQVEAYLLPRLLAQAKAALIFNFYRYQSSRTELTLRRDILDRVQEGDASAPRGAAWRLRSRPDENSLEERTYLDESGAIISRIQGGGEVMEPITLDELKRLWKSKGLPTD